MPGIWWRQSVSEVVFQVLVHCPRVQLPVGVGQRRFRAPLHGVGCIGVVLRILYRLSLMRFVCSFAWADFEIQDQERTFIGKLVSCLELEADEKEQVEEWIKVPPAPEDVYPTRIPKHHRKLFLDTVEAVVMADGVLDPDEAENLALFKELLG